MLKQDDRESKRVEETSESVGGEAPARPHLFSELGTGITTWEVVIPIASPAGHETEDAVVWEAEGGVLPSPPVLTSRQQGGPFRRV